MIKNFCTISWFLFSHIVWHIQVLSLMGVVLVLLNWPMSYPAPINDLLLWQWSLSCLYSLWVSIHVVCLFFSFSREGGRPVWVPRLYQTQAKGGYQGSRVLLSWPCRPWCPKQRRLVHTSLIPTQVWLDSLSLCTLCLSMLNYIWQYGHGRLVVERIVDRSYKNGCRE